MPICPHCNGESPQRKKGKCPRCEGQVEIYHLKKKTIWVAEKPSTKKLVSVLEKHIQREVKDFIFGTWQNKDYIAQLAMAKILLERCGGDQELAEQIIHAYFLGLPGIWPPRNMAGVIGKKFAYIFWRTKQQVEKERQKEYTTQLQIEQLEELEITYAI